MSNSLESGNSSVLGQPEPVVNDASQNEKLSSDGKKDHNRASPKQKDLVRSLTKKLLKLARSGPIEWPFFFSLVIESFVVVVEFGLCYIDLLVLSSSTMRARFSPPASSGVWIVLECHHTCRLSLDEVTMMA